MKTTPTNNLNLHGTCPVQADHLKKSEPIIVRDTHPVFHQACKLRRQAMGQGFACVLGCFPIS
jgi:hypothetical protein